MNTTTDVNSTGPVTGSGDGGNVTTTGQDPASGAGDDSEDYLYDLGTRLFIIIDVLLVGLGCVGNLITLIVSLRKNMRRSPVSIFIAALAVSDIFVLVLDFLNNWLALQLDVYLMASLPFCLFHRWFFNVAYTTSAWLVAGVAVERFLAVWYPLSAQVWCTVKNTVITVVIIPLLLGAFYAYNFWMWQVSGGKCDSRPYHAAFLNDVSPWLTGTLYSYVPLVVILTCSSAILCRLASAKQKRAALTNDSATDNTRKVTVTVLAVCAAFCCLTIPLTVWYIWVFATQQFIEQTARIVFIEICILIVGLSNHSINFFLYVMTSERFQVELKALLYCCQKSSGTTTATNTPSDDKSASSQKTNISSANSAQSINTVSSCP